VTTPRCTRSTFPRSLVALIALQLSACDGGGGGGGLSGGAWPRFRANEQSTGFVPFDTSGNGGARPWRGAIDSSPAIGPDGTVYVGSLDGVVYAVF
jgi:hypothetical protein